MDWPIVINGGDTGLTLRPSIVNSRITSAFQSLQGAFDGSYLVVGSPNRNSAIGAFGMFKRSLFSTNTNQVVGNVYTFLATYTASDSAVSDNFGQSVAVNSNAEYILVGSPQADRNSRTNCGSVYVWKKSLMTDVWRSLYQFQGSDTAASDQFGSSVSMSYDAGYFAVSAPIKNLAGPTISQAGAVYIYKKNPTTDFWNFQQRITMTNPIQGAQFGTTVEMSWDGTYILASPNGVSVNTRMTVVFKKSNTTDNWSEITRFVGVSTLVNFGRTFSMSSNADFVVQNPNPGDGTSSFVFKKNATTDFWTLQQVVGPVDSSLQNSCCCISQSGSNLLMGMSNSTAGDGAARLYIKDSTTDNWNVSRNVPINITSSGARFGSVTKLIGDGSIALVSAPFSDERLLNVTDVGYVNVYYCSKVTSISSSTDVAIGTAPASGYTLQFLPPASTGRQMIYYRSDPFYSNSQFVQFSSLGGNTLDGDAYIGTRGYNLSYQFLTDGVSNWYTVAGSGTLI